MAEPYNDPPEREAPERYDDTHDPKNPPNSVVNADVARMAFWSYLGPVVALFVIVGVALIYWTSRGSATRDLREPETGNPVGTAGERSPGLGTPGGHNPEPRPRSTNDELRSRGVDIEREPSTGDTASTLQSLDAVATPNRDIRASSIVAGPFEGWIIIATIPCRSTPFRTLTVTVRRTRFTTI